MTTIAQVLVELVRRATSGERRLGDRLARVSFSAGLGSKLSRWLVPPTMNSQITFLALGGKCGCPSGGASRRGRPLGPRDAVAMQHRAQGQAGEAHAHVGQESPSRWHGRITRDGEGTKP